MEFEVFKKIVLKEVDRQIIKAPYKKKSHGSFSELLFSGVSRQSIAIRMGNVLESSYNEFLEQISQVEVLKFNSPKHQLDILFIYENAVYYFESKANLNIDTEKSQATYDKIKNVESFLKEMYDGKKIIAKILCSRYNKSKNVKCFKEAYIPREMIYGYANFFNIFKIKIDEKEWENFFRNEIGKKIETTM